MRAFNALVSREFKSYFNSPIAYIALLIFQILPTLLFFGFGFFIRGLASYQNYFFWAQMIYIILIPALTMRSWAEEKRQRTDEILVTLPYSEWSLVLAKYCAALLLLLVAIVLTFFLPLTTIWLGNFDLKILIGQYFGIILLGALGVSLGIFISSLCKNQITAFLVTVIILFLMLALWPLLQMVSMPQFIAKVIAFFSFSAHFDSFSRGLMSSKDIIYFVGISFLFIYLTVMVIRFRKYN